MLKTWNERAWLTGGLVAAALMVIAGLAIFIGPQHEKTSSVDSQIAAAELQNGQLQSRINVLSRDMKNLDTYKANLAEAQLALPSTSGLPDFIRTLQSIAQSTSTNVTNYKADNPIDVSKVPGASGVKVGNTPVYALPLSAQISGTVEHLHEFLRQLQQVQPRAVLISQITENVVAADGWTAKAGDSLLTVTMQAFVAPVGQVERGILDAGGQK